MTFQMQRNVPTKTAVTPVFDENGKTVYTPKSSGKKSVDAIAREVIQGKWGNGADRKNRLTKAGYNYNTVQKRVNEILS